MAAEYARRAAECERLGNKLAAKLDHSWEIKERAAAAGCDITQVWREFSAERRRFSVGLNEEALSILDDLGVPARRRAGLLGRIVEEALFAIADFAASGGHKTCELAIYRMSASAGNPRWCERYESHTRSRVLVEYALAAATYGEPSMENPR